MGVRSSRGDLFDELPDPVIGIDAERRIVEWNRAAEDLYGFSRDEALGRPAPELLRTRFPAPLAEIAMTVAETGAWEGALVHRDRDGLEVIVDSRWSALRGDGGSTLGAVWIDRRQPARTPAADPPPHPPAPPSQQRDHLSQLASKVGHDFNNLLAVIINYSVLVGQELEAAHRSTGEERWALLRSDVGEIRLAAQRATQLSRQLLAATRGEDDAEVGLIGSPAEPELPESRNG